MYNWKTIWILKNREWAECRKKTIRSTRLPRLRSTGPVVGGNRAVLLDYCSNSVSFDPGRRTFRIQVDDGNEDDWTDSFMEEDTETAAQRLGLEFQTPEEDDRSETCLSMTIRIGLSS